MIAPGSFDSATCAEVVEHAETRLIGAAAREAADHGDIPADFPYGPVRSYWDAVVREMRWVVYCDAYSKRAARLARIANKKPPVA